MRRWLYGIMSGVMMVALTGCVAVSAKENQIGMTGGDREVVTIDKQVYLVNKTTGTVWRLDVSKAETYHHTPQSTETSSTQ